jgi:hypothetical protein
MSSQLLGANASLNAPGGRPGAAPTVLQGALISGATTVQGNSQVNGTLTVTQPAGGGVRTCYFTDGNTGVAENSLGIFNDQTSTSLVFTDTGVSGNMTFEGAAQAGTGEFGLTKPLRVANINPVAGSALFFGTPTEPGTYTFNCPTSGGGTRAMIFTDNQAGVDENSLGLFLNQGNVFLNFTDSGSGGQFAYDGTLLRFVPDRSIQHPSVQAGKSTAIVTGSGIAIPGITGSSVVHVTMESNTVGPVGFTATPGTDTVTVVFTGGGSAVFNWFVARF